MLYREQTLAPRAFHSELHQQTNTVNTQKIPPWACDKGCAEACAERFSALKSRRWSDTASTRLGPTETWLARKKTSAILDSHSAGMRRSFAQIYYWTRFLECFFEKVLWGVVSLMTTRTVLVLATVVSIRDKFFYPCCARCHKKVYFRDAEATMWVRLFDCFEMQQHYTRSLNVKFLCCCWLFLELQALQSY